jgi:hypothetical protein
VTGSPLMMVRRRRSGALAFWELAAACDTVRGFGFRLSQLLSGSADSLPTAAGSSAGRGSDGIDVEMRTIGGLGEPGDARGPLPYR